MSRPLSLFCIGLVFGGGIGFLIAAANGITLDGHDHGPTAAPASHDGGHEQRPSAAAARHDHAETLALAEGADAPALTVAVTPDAMSGWNLRIVTENFRFAPDHASGSHVAGEGHAHIYVNGEKMARQYGPWFHIATLPTGRNLIEVTLNSNDHRVLAVAGKPLKASVSVDAD